MSNLAHSQMLTRYNAWTNQQIFKAVMELPEGEATKERPTLFKNIVHSLNHNYVIDLMWQAHIQGRDHGFKARNTETHPPLEELWQAQQKIDQWYISWSESLTEDSLKAKKHFTLVGGNQGVMTCEEIIFHIVSHTSYHRGFVADLFFQIPAQPPLTDLPIFLRESS